jgi:hypothetical protein
LPEYYAQKDKIINAQKEQGINTINDIYNPMVKGLQNNVASRFGTLNASTFIDELNNIEKNRAGAVAKLSQDLLANSSKLDDSQRTQNYDFINLISGLKNSSLDDIYNMLGLSRLSSDLLNSYNLANFNKNATNAANSAGSIDWTPYYLR